MSTPTRITAFVATLAVAFLCAYGVGRVTGVVGPTGASAHSGDGGGSPETHDSTGDHAAGKAAGGTPAGLQVSEAGYTMEPLTREATAGERDELAFRVLDDRGEPVTDFTPTHEKRMHLVVVRRDLSGFQHLHPSMSDDGTWRIPVTFPAAGDYRVFADFRPQQRSESLTLGADVPVAGEYTPRALPEPTRSTTVDGYTVRRHGGLVTGRGKEIAFTVEKDGEPVTDLQPYLGAYGHLVALRSGDLRYLHVHPQGEPGDGRTSAEPRVAFHATAPSSGRYRLYLDFRHDGEVRTAEFTVDAPRAEAASEPTAGDGHDSEQGSEHGSGHAH